MTYRLTIKEMAPDERPREKLRLRGASTLSNGELLAILLNTGLPGEPVTEVASRLAALGPDQRPQISSPDDVVNLVGIEMAALDQEQLRVILLDTKHRIQAVRLVYQGSVNQAQVRIAEVFREAIRHNAVAVVAVHNHPSGDPTPSAADVALTAELAKAGELLDIEVLDHVIIGHGRHLSLRRLGLG